MEVTEWRHGTDFQADLVHLRGSPFALVESPHNRFLKTTYEGEVDFTLVVAKEAAALHFARQAGVRVPKSWRCLALGRRCRGCWSTTCVGPRGRPTATFAFLLRPGVGHP